MNNTIPFQKFRGDFFFMYLGSGHVTYIPLNYAGD